VIDAEFNRQDPAIEAVKWIGLPGGASRNMIFVEEMMKKLQTLCNNRKVHNTSSFG
jgi:4-hydroxy-3-methylbut-2-enyl diphosphate reductase IspH